jgi:D-aminoacyl-tRNA deacylase
VQEERVPQIQKRQKRFLEKGLNKGIIFSRKDPAGKNVAQALLEHGFKQKTEYEQTPVYQKKNLFLTSIPEDVTTPASLDQIARKLGLDSIVMASRHKSKTEKPCFTVHPTGNYGQAMYGGQPHSLQNTSAHLMRNIFLELLENPFEQYSVSMEATHHGPTKFETPIAFAELGSSPEQWQDLDAAAFLAKAILKGASSEKTGNAFLGFGGGHYCPRFSRLEKEKAFGHVCPQYSVDLLDQELINQMKEKTIENIEGAVLDKKGLKSEQKKTVKQLLTNAGIDFE